MASNPSIDRVSQAELARALGVSKPYINKLVTRGVVPLGDDGLIDAESAMAAIAAWSDPDRQMRAASDSDTEAMRRVRQMAMEPQPVADTTASAETAEDANALAGSTSYQRARIEREMQMGRQAKERADQLAMENAVRRGELAPVTNLEQVLAKTAARVAAILDAIPGAIRRRVPALTAADISYIAAEIAQARNIVSAMSLADLSAEIDAADVLQPQEDAA